MGMLHLEEYSKALGGNEEKNYGEEDQVAAFSSPLLGQVLYSATNTKLCCRTVCTVF